MSTSIKLRKGLSINMRGKAEKVTMKAPLSVLYAVKPFEFHGFTPKLVIEVGDKVKAGSLLAFDKKYNEICLSSPVSGTVERIVRGERRIITEIVIRVEEKIEYENFGKFDIQTIDRETIKNTLLKSGLWLAIRQRPFNVIANPHLEPKAICISCFDTAPLAPDVDFLLRGYEKEFHAGIEILSKLTKAPIHLGVDGSYPVARIFSECHGVQIHEFSGVHPAGNVGVQIHHICPINKGEIVWTIDPQHVLHIGRLFIKGIYDASKIVALTGSEVLKPRYFRIINGASIASLIENNINKAVNRYISGNVLTGRKIEADGYVGFFDSQVTVIPEGNYTEFLGWAMPGFSKFSASRAFWSWLFPGREYRLDTNMHGGVRPFVLTSQYEKVLPMNIYPVYLLKAIMAGDIDKMEQLGIYEVVEEDLALCEFVCASKIPVQKILRDGFSMLIKEMN